MSWSVTTLVSRRACWRAARTVSAASATASCHTLRSRMLAAMPDNMDAKLQPPGTNPLRGVLEWCETRSPAYSALHPRACAAVGGRGQRKVCLAGRAPLVIFFTSFSDLPFLSDVLHP